MSVSRAPSAQVCFPHVDDAMAFMARVQSEFLELDWPEDILEADSCRTQLDGWGRKVWRGPRVRMGAHVGPADVEYQPHLRRVDYFGPTVNCAARIQGKAHGGQCLISGAMAADCDPQLQPQLQALGNFQLKGIQDLVPVFEFATVAGRTFAPIDAGPGGAEEEPQPLCEQTCGTCFRPLQCRACKPFSPRGSYGSPGVQSPRHVPESMSPRSRNSGVRSQEPPPGSPGHPSGREEAGMPVHRTPSWLRNFGRIGNKLTSSWTTGKDDERDTGAEYHGPKNVGSTLSLLPGQMNAESGGESDLERAQDAAGAESSTAAAARRHPSSVGSSSAPPLRHSLIQLDADGRRISVATTTGTASDAATPTLLLGPVRANGTDSAPAPSGGERRPRVPPLPLKPLFDADGAQSSSG